MIKLQSNKERFKDWPENLVHDYKSWIDKCLERSTKPIETLKEYPNLKRFYAYRWLEIDDACSAMGGYANFSHWINRHAVSYFNIAGELDAENKALKRLLKEAMPIMERNYLKKAFFDEANKILNSSEQSMKEGEK